MARIDELAGEMAAALTRFEAMLDGRAYLMGDEFSAADCAAYPFLKDAPGRDPADEELFTACWTAIRTSATTTRG